MSWVKNNIGYIFLNFLLTCLNHLSLPSMTDNVRNNIFITRHNVQPEIMDAAYTSKTFPSNLRMDYAQLLCARSCAQDTKCTYTMLQEDKNLLHCLQYQNMTSLPEGDATVMVKAGQSRGYSLEKGRTQPLIVHVGIIWLLDREIKFYWFLKDYFYVDIFKGGSTSWQLYFLISKIQKSFGINYLLCCVTVYLHSYTVCQHILPTRLFVLHKNHIIHCL